MSAILFKSRFDLFFISITSWKYLALNVAGLTSSTWNNGMMEYWNNGKRHITSVFGSRMPFHVGAKAKNNDQDERAHDLDVSHQLLYEINRDLYGKFKTWFVIHLPWFSHESGYFSMR